MKRMMWFYIRPDETLHCPICDNRLTVNDSNLICPHVSFIYHSDNIFVYWADHMYQAVKEAIEFEFTNGNIVLDCIMTESDARTPIVVLVSRPKEYINQSTPVIIVGITLVD